MTTATRYKVPAHPLLRIDSVSKSYGHNLVLNEVSFDVFPGEVIALVGRNGAGKSTLINCLAGATPISEGQIQIDAQKLTSNSIRKVAHFGIGVAHQNPSLVPHWTISEHFENFGSSLASQELEVWLPRRALEDLCLDLDIEEELTLEFLRASKIGKRLVLADEPLAGLSSDAKMKVLSSISNVIDTDKSIIWVSHDIEAAKRFSSRIIVLEDGSITGDLLAHETTVSEVLDLMGKSDIYEQNHSEMAEAETVSIDSFDVTLSDELPVMKIPVGSTTGIIGDARSGAREVLRSIMGRSSTFQAKVAIGKRNIKSDDVSLWQAGVRYLSRERQTEWLFPEMSVGWNASISALSMVSNKYWLDQNKLEEFSQDLLEKYVVSGAGRKSGITDLSGGNRQKLILGRLLESFPRLLLLDEPFSGVDLSTRALLRRRIRERDPLQLSTIVFSQEIEEIFKLCDTIFYFSGGTINGPYRATNELRDKLTEAIFGGIRQDA